MLFPTVEFAIFFAVAFYASWAAYSSPRLRKTILLIASYFFYSYWDWRFAILLFETTLANFLIGLWLESSRTQTQRKMILYIAIFGNLALLAYFKYWGFFLANITEIFGFFGISSNLKITDALLPVGISFFTFQGISYIVDIYRNKIPASTSILDFFLYPSFFPHLVAGPIVRSSDILPQLAKLPEPQKIRISYAFILIATGLFKKVVIAHYLAVELVNPVFESPSDYSGLDLIFGAYGYALQIYCDFSAYSDLAIGIAELLGIQFNPNFNQPYRSLSLQDFWRRWHISLSSWLRDYLYISLGGSRRSELRTQINLFLTMFLGGLWHGASWNFVSWGVLHGIGLGFERLLRKKFHAVPNNFIANLLRFLIVFHFVCFTWIFFNADSWSLAIEYITSIHRNISESPKILSVFVLSILALGFAAQFAPENFLERIEKTFKKIPIYAQASVLALAVLFVSAIGPGALAPFIYFRF